MVWLLSLFIFWTAQALGQQAVSIESLDYNHTDAYDFDDVFHRGPMEFPRLKADVRVKLRPELPIYTLPGYVRRHEQLKRGDQVNKCWYVGNRPPLSGQVLWISGGAMAVKLDQGPDFCGGNFGAGLSDRDVVFISTESVKEITTADEDAQTEAGLTCDGGDCARKNALNELADKLITMSFTNAGCEQFKTDWKSDEALEGYLQCHGPRDASRQRAYEKFYKPLIELAGQQFSIMYRSDADVSVRPVLDSSTFQLVDEDSDQPVDRSKLPVVISANSSVMKCLGLRESRWDKTASSGAATGIGQQTVINVKDLNAFMEQNAWARDLWNQYFKSARQKFSNKDWKELITNPVTGRPCSEGLDVQIQRVKTVNAQTGKESSEVKGTVPDANCPINSIAGMALYQVMVELNIRRNNPKFRDHAFTPEEFSGVALLGALAHNAGITRVGEAARNGGVDTWVDNALAMDASASRKKEMRDYRKYINRCLQRDNWLPPDGGNPPDCSNFKPKNGCQ